MSWNHPETIPTPTLSPWKNCFPWNQFRVPKKLGTIAQISEIVLYWCEYLGYIWQWFIHIRTKLSSYSQITQQSKKLYRSWTCVRQADFCFFKSPPLLFQGSQFPTYLFIPLILSSVYFLHSPLLSFVLLFFSLSLPLFCPISCFPYQGGREATLSILIVIFLALSKSCLKKKEAFWYQERTTFLKTEYVTLFQFLCWYC